MYCLVVDVGRNSFNPKIRPAVQFLFVADKMFGGRNNTSLLVPDNTLGVEDAREVWVDCKAFPVAAGHWDSPQSTGIGAQQDVD